MPQDKTLLEETLTAWREAREGIIAELENLPANRFDWRPADEVRSVEELTRHILEVALMMTGELTRPDTDFHRAEWPELLAMYGEPLEAAESRDDLLHLLQVQLEDGIGRFRAQGELALYQFITQFDGSQATKFSWFQHGIAQEMYHRGQLALYARLLGEVPALTKKIEGA